MLVAVFSHGSGSASLEDLRADRAGGANNEFVCMGPLESDNRELLRGLH